MTKPFLSELVKTFSETKDPALLAPYAKSSTWEQFETSERLLVADLFLLQGEKELTAGTSQTVESFEIAKKISNSDTTVLYKIALFYSLLGRDEAHLTKAIHTLKELLQKNPDYDEARALLGSTLLERSGLTGNSGDCEEADLEFSQVRGALSPHTLWNWGEALHRISIESGEASDTARAIEKYKMALAGGFDEPLLINALGNALVELALLVENPSLFEEAALQYQRVTEVAPLQFEGWFNLACTESRIWLQGGEEKHFYSACKAFERAVELQPDEWSIWQKWAHLLFETGRGKQQEKLLFASIEKFSRADALNPNHPQLLSNWAEAELLVGMMQERLESLKLSESLLQRAIQLEPENGSHLSLLGEVNLELGRYFEEASYLHKAIDLFRRALSCDKSAFTTWHALAGAHHLLGRMEESKELIERSLSYYAKAHELDGELDPELWNEWGVALIKMGELTEERSWIEAGSEKFEHAIRLHYLREGGTSPRADWLYNWGCCLDALGEFSGDEKNYEKAIKVLSQAVHLDPEHHWAKFHLALSFAHLGETVSEPELIERSYELFAELTNDQPEDDVSWNEWGIALMKHAEILQDVVISGESKKLIASAKEKFEKALLLGNETALYSLAAAVAFEGDHGRAMDLLRKANQRGVLPTKEELLSDDWIRELRQTEEFHHFFESL